MPYFVRFVDYAKNSTISGFGGQNLAVRFSEHEAIEYAIGFSGKVRWVWVDCFTKLPLNQQSYKLLKEAGFDICIVSPELQGHDKNMIAEFKEQMCNMEIEAVCTKYPLLWI